MSVGKVLFICFHNSARSQMAEGMLDFFAGERYKARSAGTEPSSINPMAIRVMREIGIDISGHRAKGLDEFAGSKFDLVVTVCDAAKEACPFFPGARELMHRSFADPSGAQGTESERLEVFRLVRDQIREWLNETFAMESATGRSGTP
jgi:arsenate reductase